MKKIIYLFLIMMTANFSFGQTLNNIRVYPLSDTICYSSDIKLWIAGRSFTPTSYLWSDGSTTPTISVTSSGTYTVTVSGYMGQSQRIITTTKVKNIVITPKPEIDPVSSTWVCAGDTVRMNAVSGYNTYTWSDGQTGYSFERHTNQTSGNMLDTMSIWYTATYGDCSVNSDTIVLRSVEKPEALVSPYCGNLELRVTDTVNCGSVYEYIYQNQYEVEFTETTGFVNPITYITQIGSTNVPLSILTPGYQYSVRCRPIINNEVFCWGNTCEIGVTNLSTNLTELNQNDNTPKVYKIYDMSGRYLTQRNGVKFDRTWLTEYNSQNFIVITLNSKNEIKNVQKMNQFR